MKAFLVYNVPKLQLLNQAVFLLVVVLSFSNALRQLNFFAFKV